MLFKPLNLKGLVCKRQGMFWLCWQIIVLRKTCEEKSGDGINWSGWMFSPQDCKISSWGILRNVQQISGWVNVLLRESATGDEKWASQTGNYWWLSQQSWRLCCCFFFFFLLPFRLSSTRTRSTLAPCPRTLSVTSRRGRWMSTRTRWRGNNKATKVCLTADARGAEPQPQLGLGFICLALFSLLVLFSCPEGGRQSLARLSLYGAYQKSFSYF